MWKQINVSDIPEPTKVRASWKPTADDITSIFSMVVSGGEAICLEMPDASAAYNKTTAVLKWIKQTPAISNQLTAFTRNNLVIVADKGALG